MNTSTFTEYRSRSQSPKDSVHAVCIKTRMKKDALNPNIIERRHGFYLISLVYSRKYNCMQRYRYLSKRSFPSDYFPLFLRPSVIPAE